MKSERFEQEIFDLVALGTEGDYWDFKQSWHSNNADLLHDIICMANNLTEHDGYMIIGVKNSGELSGVPTEGRKTQQNVIDFLRSKPFAASIRPTVYVKTINIDDIDLDVIVVKSTAQVPYYLTADFKDDGIVYKNHIYTRIGDTNTPKTDSADADKVEYLWKKRFGLTLSPLERAKLLLSNVENWKQAHKMSESDGYEYYNRTAPEYTVTICHYEDDEMYEPKMPNTNFYYCYETVFPDYKSHLSYYRCTVKYYSTTLYESWLLSTVLGWNVMMPNNKLLNIGNGHLGMTPVEYFEADDYKYLLDAFCDRHFGYIEHMARQYSYEKSKLFNSLLVFENEYEVNEFFTFVVQNIKEYNCRIQKEPTDGIFVGGGNEKTDTEKALISGRVLRKWLLEWRNDKPQH
jgi:hypothetical protein